MSLKDHLPKGLVDAYFENDTPAAPAQVAQPFVLNPPSATAPFVLSGVHVQPPAVTVYHSSPTPSSAVSSILADLRSKTDFDATPTGQQLKGCIDALSDTGMSDEQKSKTAMKLSRQSPAQVVAVLQGLQAVLTADKQHFDATMQTATTAEVSARQAKSAQLQSSIDAAESQLNTTRQEKSQVDAELQQKQDKIASARANYAAASESRNTELAEMVNHYQSIPEVK